jgi:hypothetical protein
MLTLPLICLVLTLHCSYSSALPADQEYISWWSSKMAVCSVDSQTLQPVACEDYDPRSWKECEWSLGFEGEGKDGV